MAKFHQLTLFSQPAKGPSVLVQKLDQHRIHDFRIFIKTHMPDAFKGMKLRLGDVLQTCLLSANGTALSSLPHSKKTGIWLLPIER